MTYKLTRGTTVLRVDDDVFIPNDPDNRDWQAYQRWLAAGNTPEAADVPPPVAPTPREWLERLTAAKQNAIFTAAVGNAALMGWLFKVSGSSYVDVKAQETIDGVGQFVSAGILDATDQATLLAP